MGGTREKVATLVAPTLEPGEQVLAACPAAPRGAMAAIAYGRSRTSRRAGRGDLPDVSGELAAFGVEHARQYLVVLTDRRCLWFRTSMTGRPKTLAGALHRGDLDTIELGANRVLGQTFGELHCARRDGTRAVFEVARVHAARADELADRFAGRAAA